MSLRHHEIAETDHRILDPFTEAKLRLLGEVAGVRAGMRHLDLACGKGELLCRWAEWFGTSGVGVDLSHVFSAAARERAVEVFSRLRVWDTEENTGVLIYVQWLDRQVEIVADRGIARCVPQVAWDGVCRTMEAAFRDGRFGEGSVEAVRAVGDLLAGPFPARPDNPNELPDRPILL